MSEILLAKPKLPEGWIDVSVGEPHVVREALNQTFDLGLIELRMLNQLPKEERLYEYPLPTGYQPLVELLQSKHGAPVIITNGAKQALGASFYALKRMGKTSVSMRNPYWALIPPLVRMHGLESVFLPSAGEGCKLDKLESLLLLAPNNPDGWIQDSTKMAEDAKLLMDKGIPVIHDAAYYTHVYLPRNYELKAVGDIQIYSISKMLGLSSLRLGYVVCPNPEFYRYIQEYMEAMTVGVSTIPQIFQERLFRTMEQNPQLTKQFEVASSTALQISKRIMAKVDPEVLELPKDFLSTPGMFGWFKVGPKCNFSKARINAIDGALFGVPGMVRMNLAFDGDRMSEIVDRLNSAKEA